MTESQKNGAHALPQKAMTENNLLDWVAHDLRAGLVPLKTYAQMLSTGILGAVNEKQADALNAIDHCAQRQADKIASVLDLVKSVEGRLEMHLASVNLPEIVEHALAHAKRDAKRRGISILTDYDPGAALADVDVSRIERIIGILMSRAVKQSAEKSQVGVELHYISEDRARIRIWDNGAGKAIHELDVLNKSCSDLMRSSFSQNLPDLDLVPVFDIVSAHKGTIRADAIEGNGTTISIYLPLTQRSRKKDAPPVLLTGALIAHRDAEQVRELERLLSDKGFSVQMAATAKQALHAARSRRFRVVLLGTLEDQPSATVRAGIASQRPEDPLIICTLITEASSADALSTERSLPLNASAGQIEALFKEVPETFRH